MESDLLNFFLKYFLLAQLLLLPVALLYGFLRKSYSNLKGQWLLHRVILVLTLVLPLVLIFKPNLLPQTAIANEVQMAEVKSHEPKASPGVNTQLTAERLNEVPRQVNNEMVLVPNKLSLASLVKLLPLVIFGLGLILLIKTILIEKIIYYRLKKNIISCSNNEGVRVAISNTITSPFSYGIMKPTIFLPANLKEDEKSIILVHELNHIRENHLVWLKLEVILKRLFWFNPLYYLLNYLGNELRELICDAKSVDEVSVKEYGKALINCARTSIINKNLCCSYWVESSLLKKRINELLGDKKMPKGLNRITPFLFIVIVLVLTLFVPVSSFSNEEGESVQITETSSTSSLNQLEEFYELSNEKGALLAHREINMKGVIGSIPEEKRDNYPLAYPMKGDYGRVTLRWGIKRNPFTGEKYFHTAIDMAFGYGKHITAAGNGTVVLSGYQKNGVGNYVLIEHVDGFYSLYAQMQNPAVSKGDKVEVGSFLGEMGSSGRSTGPHLHYAIFHSREKDTLIKDLKEFQPIARYSIDPEYFLPTDFTDGHIITEYDDEAINKILKKMELQD